MRTWQNGDSSAQVKEVIDSNFNELETYIHSIKEKRDGGWFKLFGKSKKIEDAEFRIKKQIKGVLCSLNDRAEMLLNAIYDIKDDVKNKDKNHKDITNIIESQQKTIDALTNALCEKYERGFFVYLDETNCPVVINNGKRITNEITTSLSIDWAYGELPNISTEQTAIPNIVDKE